MGALARVPFKRLFARSCRPENMSFLCERREVYRHFLEYHLLVLC